MLRFLITVGMLLALPAHADEPPGDEPMPGAAQPSPAASAEPSAAAQPPPAAQAAPAAQSAPAAAVAAPSVASEEVIPNPPRVYGYAFGGAALGSLALSAILGGVALSKSSEQEGNPSNPPLYTRDLRDSADQGRALADTSYVFLGLGIALAVTDAVLWYEIFRKPRVIKRLSDGTVVK
jgi:hypothetical protein